MKLQFRFQFIRTLFRQMLDGDLVFVTGSLSFVTALSLVPFFAVSLWLISKVQAQSELLQKYVPLARDQFFYLLKVPLGADGLALLERTITRAQDGRLGAIGAIALVIISVGLFHHLEKAFQRVWGLRAAPRPFYKRWFAAWILLISLPFGLALWAAFSSIQWIQGTGGSYFYGIVFLILGLTLVYKLLPATKVRTDFSFLGAVFATSGLYLLFLTFKYVAKFFFNYSKLYGSLAAIPTFLLWIQFFWYIVLTGVAITAALHKLERT